MFGGIEAGGTKFVCGIGTGPEDLEIAQFPTTSPWDYTPRRYSILPRAWEGRLKSIGIGSFGPVDLNPASPSFGHITSTPKLGWQNYDLAGNVARELGVAVAFDTDVNAAALGEARWGAARGLPDFIYLTIGTGIGGGALVNGQLVHGMVHAEMGHLRIPHDWLRDPYSGWCAYHGDCLEGLASGPAMEARSGCGARELAPTHPGWPLEAHYLALGVANLALAFSPRRILMGGGVMRNRIYSG